MSSISGDQNPRTKGDEEQSMAGVMASWSSVMVSVADLDEALSLWSGLFGLEIVSTKEGPDEDLAAGWSVSAGDIRRQALLKTPGESSGMLHLVEFTEPGPAVRDGAQVFDQCPKNLDIYVRDLPSRVAELRAAGFEFRTATHSDVTAPDGTRFLEIHLPAHDSINVVLLEVIGRELAFTEQGYAGVGPLIAIVADAGAEKDFYRDIFGLDVLNDNILSGPEIERMVGLPPGSALDVSIWGAADQPLGQMEVIDYRGVDGNNLYPKTVPRQRGILYITYATASLSTLIDRLKSAGIPWIDLGQRALLSGTGHFIRLQSPAGLNIEVFEPKSSGS